MLKISSFFSGEGNELMKQDQYQAAIDCYTQALKLDGRNAVYYCNRYVLSLIVMLMLFLHSSLESSDPFCHGLLLLTATS